jgi:hypothetical protein
MGHYPFTLFNAFSALIILLTLLLLWHRFAGSLFSNWPLAYYTALFGYTLLFSRGLQPYGVAVAAACALAIRFGLYAERVRLLEAIPLAYVMWRCLGLILLW